MATIAWSLTLITLGWGIGAGPEAAGGDWPGFRGARSDGVATDAEHILGDGAHLEIAWKLPLGAGYSGVSVAGGRAVTLCSDGKSDVVVALDADQGNELWRYRLDNTYHGHDGSQDGPISTPVMADGRIFALAPRGKLVALDATTGTEIWKSDLVAEHGAVMPYWGFGTSPLFAGDVLVVQLGGQNAMIGGFDVHSGRRLWVAGSDTVNYQSPIHYAQGANSLVLATGDKKLLCIDPKSGQVVWEYVHNGGGERGAACLVPVPIGAGRILLKHQDDRSCMLGVTRRDERSAFELLWEGPSLGKSYAVAVHQDGYLYGFNGRTLTCVDAGTGATIWRSRAPGDGFPILVGRHLVVLTKDGGLHIVKADPGRHPAVTSLKVFDDLCWTPPSYANGSIYARSFGEIARIIVRRGSPAGIAQEDNRSGSDVDGTHFGEFLRGLKDTPDKSDAVTRFLASVSQFPIIEPDGRVIFVYRGPGQDLVLGGDLTGFGQKQPMSHVDGTDLFYRVGRLEPDARISYAFVRDFKVLPDPRNPRKVTVTGVDEDLEPDFGDVETEMSWLAMPEWKPPTHLDPVDPTRRGKITACTFRSAALDADIAIEVYTPAGYENRLNPLPVMYVHQGQLARNGLRLVDALDNLIGRRVAPIIVVFIMRQPPFFTEPAAYAKMAGEELPAFIDARYRTVHSREGRAHMACGLAGYAAIYTALANSEMTGKLGVQSPFLIGMAPIEPVMKEASQAPLRIYLDWCKYDMRSRLEAWSVTQAGRDLDKYLRAHGYNPAGGEAHDGSGVSSWRNRTDDLLEALFPMPAGK